MAPPPGKLNARAAQILLIAVLVGLVAGFVGYVAYDSFAIAMLISGTATGGAIDPLDRLFDRR